MTGSAVLSFVLVVGVLTLTPGLDTALILRTAAIGRPRGAWGVVSGIQAGTLLWGTLTAAGVSALLTASNVAYEVLRLAGAAYLVWMGVRMVVATFRGDGRVTTDPEAASAGFGRGFRRGLLTNLLNPKVGAFYVALLPQFLPAGGPQVLWGTALAGVHVVLGLLWSCVLVLLATRVRHLLSTVRAQRTLDRVAGGVIAAFGLRLALERHP